MRGTASWKRRPHNLGKGDIFDRLERMLRIAQRFSREHPELIQLYQDITSTAFASLQEAFQENRDGIGRFYRRQLEQAKREGLVDPALDDSVTSYCIDNVILLMQFFIHLDYPRERLRTSSAAPSRRMNASSRVS